MNPRLRAGLIAVVLLVGGVQNLPFTAVSEKALKNPVAKAELESWQRLLSKVGIERTVPELRMDAVGWGNGLADAKGNTLKPLKPLFRLTGTGQAWGLFTYPNTYPHKMIIEIRVDEAWVPVYRSLESEYDWKGGVFRFRRVRGVYDDNAWNTRQSYENFVNWVSRMAFEDFPRADAIQVYMERTRAREPNIETDTSLEVRLLRIRERNPVAEPEPEFEPKRKRTPRPKQKRGPK
jgi:hypothetical protein